MLTIEEQLDQLESKIQEHRLVLDFLIEEKNKTMGQQTIPCAHCGEILQICDLVYIQELLYEPPRGCTEGDYHYECEESEFICSECNVHNKIWLPVDSNIPYKERHHYKNNPRLQFKERYSHRFREILKIRGSDRRTIYGAPDHKWIHNKHVHENFEKFGIKIDYYDKDLVNK